MQIAEERDIGKTVIGYSNIAKMDKLSNLFEKEIVFELYLDEKKKRLDKVTNRLNFDKVLGFRENANLDKRRPPGPMYRRLLFSEKHNNQLIDPNEYYSKDYFVNYLVYDDEFVQLKTYPNEKSKDVYDGRINYCQTWLKNSTKECRPGTHKSNVFKMNHPVRMFASVQKSFKVSRTAGKDN